MLSDFDDLVGGLEAFVHSACDELAEVVDTVDHRWTLKRLTAGLTEAE